LLNQLPKHLFHKAQYFVKFFKIEVRVASALVDSFAGAVARGEKFANYRLEMFEWRALVVRIKSDLVVLGAKLGRVVEVLTIAEVFARVRI